MKHLNEYLILMLCAVVATGCQSSDPEKKLTDQAYLPLKKSLYQIYNIHSITYTDLNPAETLAYELMTQVVDSFPNQEGYYTYVIHRSTRPDSTAAWINLDTWSAKVNTQQAVVNEENTPFIKLSFPLVEGKTWDGNLLNTIGKDNYLVKNAHKPFSVGNKSYPDCVTIIQSNDDNLVSTDIRNEVYARSIGLLYVEKTVLNYCTTDTTCFGKKQVKNGLVYTQTIKQYGPN